MGVRHAPLPLGGSGPAPEVGQAPREETAVFHQPDDVWRSGIRWSGTRSARSQSTGQLGRQGLGFVKPSLRHPPADRSFVSSPSEASGLQCPDSSELAGGPPNNTSAHQASAGRVPGIFLSRAGSRWRACWWLIKNIIPCPGPQAAQGLLPTTFVLNWDCTRRTRHEISGRSGTFCCRARKARFSKTCPGISTA